MTQRSAGVETVSPRPGQGDGVPAGATARERSGPVILRPRRRPGHLGPIHIVQLLLVEAALVAIAAVSPLGAIAAAVVGLVSILALVAVLARHKGRWWLESRMMTRAFRRRRQEAERAARGDDPRLAALRTLAPGLVVENVPSADGGRVGVARDDAGWYAVAALSGNTPLEDFAGDLPLATLTDALAEADQPGTVLQLVTHTLPAPSIDTHPSSPAGHSYRQLMAQFGTTPLPADQAVWIVIRLEARSLAESLGADHSDLEQAPVVVAALVRRVTKTLSRVGIAHRVLDADAVIAALARSCDLEPGSPRAEPVRPQENWAEWQSATLAHRSYWIRSWPPPGQVAALLTALNTAPAAVTSVSLVLAQDDDGMLDLCGLVRVAAPANELDQTCQAVTQTVRQARADLFQMDGEHGPAVYATAPTGGGAR